jgi:hypothetical protein
VQEPHVMDTIQGLRRRAHAAGYLRSDANQVVQEQGPVIAVVPVYPHVVYVPYYSPYVVYGPWWWPHYRPVLWRAWRPAPVVVSVNFFHGRPDWHRRHVTVAGSRWHHSPRAAVTSRPFVRVPEAQRQPIVRSLPPAVQVETPRRFNDRREPRVEQRREHHNDDRRHGLRVEQQQRKEQKQQRREAHHNRERRG